MNAPGESWLDGLGWTSLETSSVALAQTFEELLFPSEEIIAQGRAVVLVNMDVPGTLLVTNFRLMFVGESQKHAVLLGTIPLSTIEKFLKLATKPLQGVRNSSSSRVRDRGPTRRLLQVVGKDMRNIVYGFRPRTKQRRAVYEALSRLMKQSRLWDLFAFGSGLPAASTNGDAQLRLHSEYVRIISARGSDRDSGRRSGSSSKVTVDPGLESTGWRISELNAGYTLCTTYPSRLIVPSCVCDAELQLAATFRARGRLPVLSWRHGGNGAVLARSSQPLIGLMMNTRSNADEKLVAALRPPMANGSSQERKLYIADARPRKNALANGALGGGSESSANYLHSEVVFLGIDNIHVMRDSFSRLRDYLDLHGGASSDGSSSLMRTGGWAWGGSTRSSMSAAVSALGESGWLMHVHSILSSAAWIAGRLVLEGASVLVHCSDGWDRSSQLISLAELLLDPYYRTFEGFQALIEKDWLAFGHPFADRLGVPTFTGGTNLHVDVLGQPPAEATSPVRNGSGSSFSASVGAQSPGGVSNNYSPVFLQWADCVGQLLRLYPRAFEFSSIFLVELVDVVFSCRFGNFLCNNERERVHSGIADSTPDIWVYLGKERMAGRAQHEHYNILYDPAKHTGALLPPAAALAPLLWPQFYLRWACPTGLEMDGCMPTGLDQGGDLDREARIWAQTLSLMQKSKERADEKLEQLASARRDLEGQLRNERQNRSSALTVAGRAQQEAAALKRVLDTMGCKIRISKANSNHYLEGEICYEESLDDSDDLDTAQAEEDQEVDMESVEEQVKQLSVSVSMEGDSAAFYLRRACGAEDSLSCSSQKIGDSCKWPQSRCSRLGSAFVGLRADFNALEQLSILDCYFDPQQTDTGSSNGRSHVPGVI